MIIQEPYGDNLIRTYSDAGKYIIQNETGVKYAEAIDIPNKYTYTESDEDIELLNEDVEPLANNETLRETAQL